ncbi:helix-turn-helix domain-containing protein [ANME-2 cluster archaeon]|nr:helix-turn-helix domain-containing protein [Methanosarcinales archaeon]RJS73472.1 MAG: helix-turn-helix domain-containing protein [ANME-2 cluster archaeon]RLG24193.1 MAG: transcriptional regulator [Methanosarcinales archaeon]
MIADEVILAVFESDERFRNVFSRAIKEQLGMTILEFSKCASIPHSTLYKILSGHREPNVKTLRRIIETIRKLEGTEKNFIAVIAARPVLDRITERQLQIEGESVVVREYAASTMEDAIIAAVRAERDGASALVCAPIVSPTVEKILRIPVATINPTNSIVRAIELAARKRSWV